MLLIAEAAANLHMLHIFPSEGRTSHKSATIISKHFKCFPLEWLLIEIAQKYVLHINSLWNKSTCVKNMHKMEECTSDNDSSLKTYFCCWTFKVTSRLYIRIENRKPVFDILELKENPMLWLVYQLWKRDWSI